MGKGALINKPAALVARLALFWVSQR
jgi:hypothetical protein